MLRKCSVCKEQKEETEFYWLKTQNKYESRCKRCTNKKANDRINNLPVEKRRALWRKAIVPSQAKNKEHVLARIAVRKALNSGELVKLPCEKCAEPKTQAHHDDYSRPLEVRWLCHIHHRATHYPDKYILP